MPATIYSTISTVLHWTGSRIQILSLPFRYTKRNEQYELYMVESTHPTMQGTTLEPWEVMEGMLSQLLPNDMIVERHTTITTGGDKMEQEKVLRLALLACETKPPYGPPKHTAELFADLFIQAAQQVSFQIYLIIQIYNVQAGQYPDDWDQFDGVLLPGSFSTAYHEDAWILKLKSVLQEEIVAMERRTLAICFGHQILAHSFLQGHAMATPTGPRAGRFEIALTQDGQRVLGKKHVQLYYTHGDTVQALPESAVSLGGGRDGVSILSAAYYGTKQNPVSSKPYAISFQAHPEYASSFDLGVHRTFNLCCQAMEQHHGAALNAQWKDEPLEEYYDKVRQDSVEMALAVAQQLGWFPDPLERLPLE